MIPPSLHWDVRWPRRPRLHLVWTGWERGKSESFHQRIWGLEKYSMTYRKICKIVQYKFETFQISIYYMWLPLPSSVSVSQEGSWKDEKNWEDEKQTHSLRVFSVRVHLALTGLKVCCLPISRRFPWWNRGFRVKPWGGLKLGEEMIRPSSQAFASGRYLGNQTRYILKKVYLED